MSWVFLATEDEISEQVGLVLLHEAGLQVGQQLRKGGNGYLRSRVRNFCEMAQEQPVLMITDLDQQHCAAVLLSEWFGRTTKPADFLLRVAVREIESWLLADREAARKLFGSKVGTLPQNPDTLADPKKALLQLARRAPRRVREDLLPTEGAVTSQGLGYNSRLCEFVRTVWTPQRAAEFSPSLRKARLRLQELAARGNS